MSVRVGIDKTVLQWAIARTGMTAEELSSRSDLGSVDKWLEGDVQPTLKQAETLAKLASIPFGYLLLDSPTNDAPVIPDFRTFDSNQVQQFSPELEATILACQSRLNWYVDFAMSEDIPPPSLTAQFRVSDDTHDVAHKVLKELNWVPGKTEKGRERFLTFSDALEDFGILVIRNSVVGNSNSKRLDRNEFRAFTLLKNSFSLIFINGDDYKVGQYFSMAHELGHVLLGEEGITGERNDHRDVERWCNRFAADLLLPTEALIKRWNDAKQLEDVAAWVYREYGVSRDTVAWKLADHGLIERKKALEFLNSTYRIVEVDAGGSGGSFHYNVRARLGSRFLNAVTGALLDGAITQEEASEQLGFFKTKTIEGLEGFKTKGRAGFRGNDEMSLWL